DLGSLEGLAQALGIRQHVDVVHTTSEELPAELRAADVAVNPRGPCAGIPQKLMNYMAAGCPVVSFPGPAAPLRPGAPGRLAERSEPAALADGILHLLDHPELARALGHAAREEIRREYSWDRTAEKVEEVYARVLERERALR